MVLKFHHKRTRGKVLILKFWHESVTLSGCVLAYLAPSLRNILHWSCRHATFCSRSPTHRAYTTCAYFSGAVRHAGQALSQ